MIELTDMRSAAHSDTIGAIAAAALLYYLEPRAARSVPDTADGARPHRRTHRTPLNGCPS